MSKYRIVQPSISAIAIEAMTRLKPRRYRLADWNVLRRPARPESNAALSFPFRATCENLLATCPANHIGLRKGSADRAYTYLRCSEEELTGVEEWLDTFRPHIVQRDLLALSFSLDYDRENGDPAQSQTAIAQLRARAKPYDHAATYQSYAAARELTGLLVDFLQRVEAYASAKAVIAVPPSEPDKVYDLPRILAQGIARQWGRDDATSAVRTLQTRPQLKNLAVKDKLSALEGTVDVAPPMVRGRVILLVDDLYQSGISMNWIAMKILEAGATAVFGLAVEKTCRNDDNRRAP